MEDKSIPNAELPLARKDDLVIEQLSDETLVYDLRSHKAHCLNAGAALVWQHCNGEYDNARLTTLLHEKLGAPNDPSVVDVALQQLAGAKLLDVAPSGPKFSRREAARKLKLVFGATVAIPAVMSIVAPTAASAATTQIVDCATLSLALCVAIPCSRNKGNARCQVAGNSCSCVG